MEIEEKKLSPEETKWLSELVDIMDKKPKALMLGIDTNSDFGNVEAFSGEGRDFTPAQSRWIKQLEEHVNALPQTPEFWLLSNIDGFHVGKGYPSNFHGTGYGSYGAVATYSDNYDDFYVESFDVEYGDFSGEFREERDYHEFKTNRGDLKVWHVTTAGKRLQ